MATFQRARKSQARLRMALVGPPNGGKTYSALAIATGIGGRVAVIDTEHGSASKYAVPDGRRGNPGDGEFEFEKLELDNFDPRNYVAAIREAEAEGFDVLIIDSLSHAWNGPGGALDIHDRAAAKDKSNNKFAAWRTVTPLHNALVEAMLQCRCHVIATMRSKVEYAQENDAGTGRTRIRKLGMAPVQRDGIEYEFDVVGDLDPDTHDLTITKTRYRPLDGQVIARPDAGLGRKLAAWLSDGDPAIIARAESPPLGGRPEANGDPQRVVGTSKELADEPVVGISPLTKAVTFSGRTYVNSVANRPMANGDEGNGGTPLPEPAPAGIERPSADAPPVDYAAQPPVASKAQVARIMDLVSRLGMSHEDFDGMFARRGVSGPCDLDAWSADALIVKLQDVVERADLADCLGGREADEPGRSGGDGAAPATQDGEVGGDGAGSPGDGADAEGSPTAVPDAVRPEPAPVKARKRVAKA
jgi:hypothetical protein